MYVCTMTVFSRRSVPLEVSQPPVKRRCRGVALSDFGQDLLCFSDPPCWPNRPSSTIFIWDVNRENLRRGLTLSAQRDSNIEFGVLIRHKTSKCLLGPKVNPATPGWQSRDVLNVERYAKSLHPRERTFGR